MITGFRPRACSGAPASALPTAAKSTVTLTTTWIFASLKPKSFWTKTSAPETTPVS